MTPEENARIAEIQNHYEWVNLASDLYINLKIALRNYVPPEHIETAKGMAKALDRYEELSGLKTEDK